MDTAVLEDAYRALLDVARQGGFGAPADSAQWPAELILAQIAANDHLLAAATAEVLAGQRPSYDNTPASREPYLQALARAAGDTDGLVAEVRRSGLVLVLMARELDEATAASPVQVRIVDGDVVRAESPMPWSGVLATHAEVNLPERRAALQALQAGAT